MESVGCSVRHAKLSFTLKPGGYCGIFFHFLWLARFMVTGAPFDEKIAEHIVRKLAHITARICHVRWYTAHVAHSLDVVKHEIERNYRIGLG